jgi:hypothetical protein
LHSAEFPGEVVSPALETKDLLSQGGSSITTFFSYLSHLPCILPHSDGKILTSILPQHTLLILFLLFVIQFRVSISPDVSPVPGSDDSFKAGGWLRRWSAEGFNHHPIFNPIQVPLLTSVPNLAPGIFNVVNQFKRCVLHIAVESWLQWLNKRRKWLTLHPSLIVGVLVLVCFGLVVSTKKSADGFVLVKCVFVRCVSLRLKNNDVLVLVDLFMNAFIFKLCVDLLKSFPFFSLTNLFVCCLLNCYVCVEFSSCSIFYFVLFLRKCGGVLPPFAVIFFLVISSFHQYLYHSFNTSITP